MHDEHTRAMAEMHAMKASTHSAHQLLTSADWHLPSPVENHLQSPSACRRVRLGVCTGPESMSRGTAWHNFFSPRAVDAQAIGRGRRSGRRGA